MERTSKKSDKPLWRRKQYPEVMGKLHLRREPRRMIKYGEYVYATAEELGGAIGQFDLIEGDKEAEEAAKKAQEPAPTLEVRKDEYQVVGRGNGYFDVFSPAGKKMNEKALRADKADELKESLESEQEQS